MRPLKGFKTALLVMVALSVCVFGLLVVFFIEVIKALK
jgi:hypothetical protein